VRSHLMDVNSSLQPEPFDRLRINSV